jgi:hypothetical protein
MGQTTFLPLLYNFHNVFLTQENIDWAKNFNQPLVLFLLDFAKAHNKANWEFTFLTWAHKEMKLLFKGVKVIF